MAVGTNTLKRGKKAPKPKIPPATTGAITAPPSAAGGSNYGLAPAHGYQKKVSPASSLPAPDGAAGGAGAQGGTPAAPGALAPPETQQRLRERSEEGLGYGNAETSYHEGLYNAAMKYGDPAVTALYAPGVGSPVTGETEKIAKREAEEERANKLAHNANNTFFSGMDVRDTQGITDVANRDRAQALQDFKQAKKELDDVWAEAVAKHTFAGEQFDEGAQREFNETEPTPQGGGGGSGGGQTAAPGKGKSPNYSKISKDPWHQGMKKESHKPGPTGTGGTSAPKADAKKNPNNNLKKKKN